VRTDLSVLLWRLGQELVRGPYGDMPTGSHPHPDSRTDPGAHGCASHPGSPESAGS